MTDAQIMVGVEVVRILNETGYIETPELDREASEAYDSQMNAYYWVG